MQDFSGIITAWYVKNKRDLPWRNTCDPYLIWLSEVILQQTRVEQGLPYYLRFTENYPTVRHLAKANEKEVLKLWQGLGYYSRARNLHAAARYIVKNFKGKFPSSYKELIKLKGVGSYTAAAVASIAFSEAKPAVDGNVFRVLGRYFAISTPIDSGKGKKEFYTLAAELLNGQDPGTFNQAMMEFGAKQCLPKNPACGNCPLSSSCLALAKGSVDMFPVKGKKTKVRSRYFYYIIARHNKKIFIRQRKGRDIWQGLYDFPLIESKRKIPGKKLFLFPEFRALTGKNKFHVRCISPVIRHALTHQEIFATFIEVDLKNAVQNNALIRIPEKKLDDYAVPKLIERYLEAKKFHSESILQ